MSSVNNTYIDKAEMLKEIDKQLKEASIDKAQLQQRLKEINTKIEILTEKKDEITLMMLQENLGNKKIHPSTVNNSNEQNNSNTADESIENAASNKIVEEDDKNTSNLSISTINTTTNSGILQDDKNTSNSSSQTNNNTTNYNILEEEDDDNNYEEDDDANYEEVDIVKFENSEIFKNYDSLKQFFEETQNVDSYGVEIEYTGDQVSDLSQKKVAYTKMIIFRAGRFIDFYDGIIKKALYYADGYTDTRDQFYAAMENLFDALIARSKVLELYDKCGEKAGELYEQIKEVSLLQIWSKNKHFYYILIISLFAYSNCKTWSYEKVKAACEFWQAGVVSELKLKAKVEHDFYLLYNEFLNSLVKNNKLTEDERETIRSILQVTKNYCNK